ncbi:M28 family metallopeptidase [Maribacter sp. HTCC2170]|uniref:M28 family metallopeptidase n=1 Tax=Maribacter sp. (strain HTCC2170 / KCCM 42371) TaxID=313603 RepID=UPI00006AFD9B|nr:M28 family metallopeptidase [Maribacter sp. HTCC2170]EAR01162.1 putative aminopeptidase [Maribacter sp. HTCC2170]
MKNILLIFLALAMSCNSSQKAVPENSSNSIKEEPSVTFAKTITEDELKEHLFEYASDKYEGRETGEPGQKMASEYIKKEYMALGISSAKSDGDYYQNVPLEYKGIPEGSIVINGETYGLGVDVLAFSAAVGTFSNIVYAGFGIEDENYSDFTNIDINGKLVLVKFGEPKNSDGTYTVSGTNKKSKWSSMSDAIGKRTKAIIDNGGLGMIYVDQSNFGRFESYFNRMKKRGSGNLSVKANNADFINIILNNKTGTAIMPEITKTKEPRILDTELILNLSTESNNVDSENVVAYIEGSSKPNEYVVISSHLDHIGVTKNGEINNGADDDGSGTVALLEIAEAFKQAEKAGQKPKRSIVFLHVTGEEKGLLGSKYYTDNDPIFPLQQTVANLNIDMIGRIDPKREGDRNYIYLIGSDKLSTDLHNLSEAVNKKYANIELDYTYNDENDPNRFYYRSDHYNFAKNNIPIIFYFNGTHDDYHRPSDTADKINYDLLENRSRLIFHTAWEIANRDQKVIVDKSTK